jgi:RHS repeat-associated protein
MGGTGGGKLRKTVVQDGELTLMKDYTSGYVYRNAELDYFKSENGRIRKTASGYTPEYHLTDHLGNVRVAFEPNGSGGLTRTLEQHYYPFGMELPGLSYDDGVDNEYRYNGKEHEKEHELHWYHYGARYYDPKLGRWHSPDPAEQFHSLYMYSFNNPIKTRDFDGKWGFSIDWDLDLFHYSFSGGIILEFGNNDKFQIGTYDATGITATLANGAIPTGGNFGVSLGMSFSTLTNSLLDWGGRSVAFDFNVQGGDFRYAISEDGRIGTASTSIGVGSGFHILSTQSSRVTGIDIGAAIDSGLDIETYLYLQQPSKFKSNNDVMLDSGEMNPIPFDVVESYEVVEKHISGGH